MSHPDRRAIRNGGIVTYQVAGASHQAGDIPGRAPDKISFASIQDMMKAGMKMPDMAALSKMMPAGAEHNDFIWQPLVRGAFHNLELWAREGIRPPEAPRIALDDKLEIERDQNGNAIDGLRMPYIDAPTAAHTGYITVGGFGGVMGTKRPFPPATLKAMYADHAAYVTRFSAATDRLVAGRWISAEDGEAMKKAAAASDVPD